MDGHHVWCPYGKPAFVGAAYMPPVGCVGRDVHIAPFGGGHGHHVWCPYGKPPRS
ncbi:MAG: hypothetical protein FWG36_10195 [Oscillospiraceae bacterium]|nr:hypothetical protein [Oscillospiraceae bacterium]